jgi:hypothetical protein
MQFKTSMKTIAGAVALALSSHVFAQTGNNIGVGDVYLSIDDTTTGASYILDTGISANSTFAGTGPAASLPSITLSGTNYSSFESSIAAGDAVEYSVFAGTNSAPTNTKNYEVFVGATNATSGVTAASGSNIKGAWNNIGALFSDAPTPAAGGSDYIAAGSSPPAGFSNSGLATNVGNDLTINDEANLGTALNFFSEVTVNPSSATTIGTESADAGTWLLNGNTLSYTVGTPPPPPVPLPAPLLLLVSGLGMMGVVGRRRSGASA